MKKLMLAVFAVALAGAVQAASVIWQSGTIYVAADATGAVGTQKATLGTGVAPITAMVYMLDQATWEGLADKSAVDLYNTYSSQTPSATKTSVGNGTANTAAITVADNSTAYALILYVDTKNAETILGEDGVFVKSALVSQIVGTTTAQFNNAISSAAGNWAAVPEPTSGLLLLLGMAGLALKRKIA